MTDIAVSIVTHHSPLDALEEAVASVRKSALDCHVTLADNASDDSYREQLKSLDCDTLLLRNENDGFGAGHNAAQSPDGESAYVLILNPDVLIHEGTLEYLVDYLAKHAEVGAVIPKVLNPDGTLQYVNKREPSVFVLFARRFLPAALQKLGIIKRRMDHYDMRDTGYDEATQLDFMSGCFMMMRRDIWQRVGGFNERFFLYLEDADITKRINAISEARYVPDVAITHRWARGSHRSFKLMLVMLHSMWVYFSIWGWRLW